VSKISACLDVETTRNVLATGHADQGIEGQRDRRVSEIPFAGKLWTVGATHIIGTSGSGYRKTTIGDCDIAATVTRRESRLGKRRMQTCEKKATQSKQKAHHGTAQ
jgi:hypothetical protein